MDEKFDYGIKVMLSTAKNGYEDQIESLNVFKATSRTVFSASSIILSLVGALQVFTTIPTDFKVLYQIIIAGISVLYLALVIISLVLISPARWTTPLKLDWDYMAAYIGNENEENSILKETSAYLGAIDKNRKTVKCRRRMTILQEIIFCAIVLAVLFAGLIPHLT